MKELVHEKVSRQNCKIKGIVEQLFLLKRSGPSSSGPQHLPRPQKKPVEVEEVFFFQHVPGR